jgi:hypothetical protein
MTYLYTSWVKTERKDVIRAEVGKVADSKE